jgi:steroid delta-isomerase-like uncharacterized protein
MSEQNKALMRRIYDVFNTGNLASLDELVDANIVDHVPLPAGQVSGIEGVKQTITRNRTGAPDLHYTVEDMIAEGDKVVARVTTQGTHMGEFMGIPPTGKQASNTGIDIIRFANGKAVEHWGEYNNLGLLRQLGVIPAQR